MEHKALGRGISALIPQTSEKKSASADIASLKLAEITLNRFQPRMSFHAQKEQELLSSIKEKGVIQPILVRRTATGYELIAGERRLRAVKALGFSEIPAIVRQEVSDADALELSLIENIQRDELDPIEEANAYHRLESDFNFTQDKIAQAVGKDRSTIANALRLLKLPKEIQSAISKGDLSVGHARLLLSLGSSAEQARFSQQILQRGWSVREAENLLKKGAQRKIRKSSAGTKDAHLVKLEEELQKILGTKVRISHLRKRGKITIEYYSLNDLERIVHLLKGKRS
jgi:ParB family chromosome partitioning protein